MNVTDTIIRAIRTRQDAYRETLINGGFNDTNARLLMLLNSVGVWAENSRTIVIDVPDTASARIHGETITGHLADVNLHALGIEAAIADRAEVTQRSETRAILTF